MKSVQSRGAAEMRSGFVETEDGLKLFWQATGSGPPLVCCNGLGVSTFFWRYIVEQFRDRYEVIVWDYRGHGRSDRPQDPYAVDLSIPTFARDLGLVLEATGARSPVLMGHSMGCQVILERVHQAPHEARGLVLLLGGPGRVLSHFNNNPRSPQLFKGLHLLVKALDNRVNKLARVALRGPLAWKVTKGLAMVDPLYTSKADFLPYLEHMASLDLRLFCELVASAQRHDARPYLNSVEQPTLIFAAERDDFFPLWVMKDMAERIPNASLLVLADGSHAAIIEQPWTINHRLERFLREEVPIQSGLRLVRPAS